MLLLQWSCIGDNYWKDIDTPATKEEAVVFMDRHAATFSSASHSAKDGRYRLLHVSDQECFVLTPGWRASPLDGDEEVTGYTLLDAVEIVLRKSAAITLGAKDLLAEMAKQKLWESNGKTPESTVLSRINQDIREGGIRFVKVQPGKFALRSRYEKDREESARKGP